MTTYADDLDECAYCGVRCHVCDERMCAEYGPEPAETCAAHGWSFDHDRLMREVDADTYAVVLDADRMRVNVA